MVAAIIRPRPQRRDDHRLAARFRLEKRGEHHARCPPPSSVSVPQRLWSSGRRCGFRQPFHL